MNEKFKCPSCGVEYKIRMVSNDLIFDDILTNMVKNYVTDNDILNKVEVYCVNCKKWFTLGEVLRL